MSDPLPSGVAGGLAGDVAGRVLAVHRHDPDGGAAAAAWVAELPALLDALSGRWRLGPLRLLSAGFAVVAECEHDDGARCVLKLGVPGTEQPRREVHWLRRVARAPGGSTAVALLEADPGAGAQLLARVEPGGSLADELLAAAAGSHPSRSALGAADDGACEVLAAAAAGVRRPALPVDAGVVPTLGSQLEELFEQERTAAVPAGPPGSSPLPGGLVAAAALTARRLLAAGAPDALLHGDLHHGNVLRDGTPHGGGWTVIDPHGLVGDPAYELACSVYNPFELGDLVAPRAVARCERLAAASGLPPDRVRGWALVQAVLSAVWFLDTGEDGAAPTRHVLGVAERLAG